MRMSLVAAACVGALACDQAKPDAGFLATYIPEGLQASDCRVTDWLPVVGTPPFRLCEVIRGGTLLRLVYDANGRVVSFLEVAKAAGPAAFEARTENLADMHGAPAESCQSDGTITREWAVDSVYLHLSFVPVEGDLEFEASYRPVEHPLPCPYEEGASQAVVDTAIEGGTAHPSERD